MFDPEVSVATSSCRGAQALVLRVFLESLSEYMAKGRGALSQASNLEDRLCCHIVAATIPDSQLLKTANSQHRPHF